MNEFQNNLIEVAALLCDKSRSVMLWNLMDGRSHTATELSICADISPQSASNHLAKLVNAGILQVRRQGKYRHYTLASAEAAHVMESIATLLPPKQDRTVGGGPELSGITYARTCYDHIAGKVGVAITDSLVKKRLISPSGEDYIVTDRGNGWFSSMGFEIEDIRSQRRSFARQCLDWSERKPHLAGALGASFLQMILKRDWARKTKLSRELLITAAGKSELMDTLELEI